VSLFRLHVIIFQNDDDAVVFIGVNIRCLCAANDWDRFRFGIGRFPKNCLHILGTHIRLDLIKILLRESGR